ncbi:sensor histidine kinase [Tunicatimonas pelagia]|uniref:sensor histidine kinase n=1 Tax=Tunicatimonas pelagia TaxID=931531 RepID=UPI002666CC20|nr:sensor histidine kinase [Tunicatimonas pelagia]WKN42819.1 sensor histidine kinase [Tunicatimonas pelagia]
MRLVLFPSIAFAAFVLSGMAAGIPFQLNVSQKKEVLFHLLGWVAFFGLLVAVFAWPYPNPFPVLRIFLVMLILIGFYYTNTEVLIPQLLARKKVYVYIAAVLACIVTVNFWDLWVQRTLNAEFYYEHDWYERAVIQRATLLSMLVLAVSGGLKMTQEWFRTEKQKNNMEQAKIASELALLKSQINPHSLFNNLNSIYSLAVRKSEDAPKAIVKLSEMMRYILYDSSAEQISLEQEIDHLHNFLDLQRLRIHREAHLSFETSGGWQGKMIAPMLLEPFVENAFKHGNIHQAGAEINILLKVEKEQLWFRVKNTMNNQMQQKDVYSGIGLVNIRKRLNLLYSNRHKLHVEPQEEVFITELNLQLSS